MTPSIQHDAQHYFDLATKANADKIAVKTEKYDRMIQDQLDSVIESVVVVSSGGCFEFDYCHNLYDQTVDILRKKSFTLVKNKQTISPGVSWHISWKAEIR
jgi:hypothetical protein